MIANEWVCAFVSPPPPLLPFTFDPWQIVAMLWMLWWKVYLPWKCKLFLSSVTDFIYMETRRENSAPACRWEPISATAKLTVAVIVQSHRPKIPVWRVHEGRLFRARAESECAVSGYTGVCGSGLSVFCRGRSVDMPALAAGGLTGSQRARQSPPDERCFFLCSVSCSLLCF